MRRNKYAILLITSLLWVIPAMGQKSAIQLEIEQAREEIEQINQQLSKNKAQQIDKQQTTRLLDQKIVARQKVVNSLGQQMGELQRSLGAEGQRIVAFNSEIDSLQSAAKILVVKTYKLTKLAPKNTLMSISAASEIVTLKYNIALITNEIRNRKYTLDTMAAAAGMRLSTIKEANEQLTLVATEKKGELAQIAREKEEAAKLAKQLKNEEKNLQTQVTQKQKLIDKLQEQIRQAIENESTKQPRTNQTGFSKEFSGNKGRLISPITGGKIVDNYGVHDHPSQKGVKVNNKGVNLRGAEGAAVTAVFKGEVRAVFGVEGMGTSVLLRHGEYLTVYSNLTNVTLKTGQSVAGGEQIGKLQTNELHFEVWHETKTLNPAAWVAIK